MNRNEVLRQVRRQSGRLPAPVAAGLLMVGAVLAFGNFAGIQGLYPARAATLEGTAYYAEGDFTRAVERLREAVAEDSADADAQYQLGSAYLKQERTTEALAAFLRAHALVPHSPKPLFNAGHVLEMLGRPAEARERFMRAAELATDPALAAAARARAAALDVPARASASPPAAPPPAPPP